MAMVGYARVSTDDQSTVSQRDQLLEAGCQTVHEEHGSGGNRKRPKLTTLVQELEAGDTLVVVRIDRLARSLSHLLSVIEYLKDKGVGFKSLTDPIDTTSPHGVLVLQVLGAAAEFERAMIRERTVAGVRAAAERGRVGGNPGLRNGDPAALKKVVDARDKAYLDKLNRTAQQWVSIVRRMRPNSSWEKVTSSVNGSLPTGASPWTRERLIRAVKRYAKEGLIDPGVLGRPEARPSKGRQLVLIAGMKAANPKITLQAICDRLEELGELTPRGRKKWAPWSVRKALDRAASEGLLKVRA